MKFKVFITFLCIICLAANLFKCCLIKSLSKSNRIKPNLVQLDMADQIEYEASNECGIQEIDPTFHHDLKQTPANRLLNKIVNGERAAPDSWPWMVSIRFVVGTNTLIHLCGGALIRKDIVLTAAHCLYFRGKILRKNQMAVVVGLNENDVSVNKSNTHQIEELIPHHSYNISAAFNDIAILRLKDSVISSTNVALICLPNKLTSSDDEILNKVSVTIGFGSVTGNTEKLSDLAYELQQANMRAIDDERLCNAHKIVRNFYEPSKHYCVIGFANNANICKGDSGGPLMYYKENKWYIYGIASFGNVKKASKCDYKMPTYFIKVTEYIDWLASVL
jgi:secreted trypsin-like serine protease